LCEERQQICKQDIKIAHHHLRHKKLRHHEEGPRLARHGVAYGFHDYKTEGIAKEKLRRWSDELGWETLLNRAGTTFRKLPDSDKEGLNERKALALMLAQPSMIKRPVLDLGGKRLVGFKPETYAREVAPSGRSRRG
jgi:arsenate reductase (glutaredoxin)